MKAFWGPGQAGCGQLAQATKRGLLGDSGGLAYPTR